MVDLERFELSNQAADRVLERDRSLQKLRALGCCVVFGDPETVKAILPKAKAKAFRTLAKPKSPCVDHQ
jgi:hypothetical protein